MPMLQAVIEKHSSAVANAVKATSGPLLESMKATANPEATLPSLCRLTGSDRETGDVPS